MRATRAKTLKAQISYDLIDQIAMRSEQTMKKDEHENFRVKYIYFLTNPYKNAARILKREWKKRFKYAS